MSLHIVHLELRAADGPATTALTNEQRTELEEAARAYIQATWSQGWRGAGNMGTFAFGGRTVQVTCMALQHLDPEVNEGQFLITHG